MPGRLLEVSTSSDGSELHPISIHPLPVRSTLCQTNSLTNLSIYRRRSPNPNLRCPQRHPLRRVQPLPNHPLPLRHRPHEPRRRAAAPYLDRRSSRRARELGRVEPDGAGQVSCATCVAGGGVVVERCEGDLGTRGDKRVVLGRWGDGC